MKILSSFFRIMNSLIILFITVMFIMMVNGLIGSDISIVIMNQIESIDGGKIIYTIIPTIILIITTISVFISGEEPEENEKKGMIMDYEAGNVLVTKETFENIATSVIDKYEELASAKVKVELLEKGLEVNIYTFVMPDTVVSTITTKLQKDIKDTVAKLTTVKVTKVNIKVKGVYGQSK